MANLYEGSKPEDFPIFKLSDNVVDSLVDKSISYYLRIIEYVESTLGLECRPNKYTNYIDRRALRDIVIRIEKRRVYFHIYYDGLKMGELNEGALICFWILKLMPFKHDIISNSVFNASIAFVFLIKLLFYVAAQRNINTGNKLKIKVNITDRKLVNNLMYAFKYRDLSKEAIMALAESLLYTTDVSAA